MYEKQLLNNHPFRWNTSTASRSLILVGWEKQLLWRNWNLHQPHSILLCSTVLSSWSNELCRCWQIPQTSTPLPLLVYISTSTLVCLCTGLRFSNLSQKVLHQDNWQTSSRTMEAIFIISVIFPRKISHWECSCTYTSGHHTAPQLLNHLAKHWQACVSRKARAIWLWAKKSRNIFAAGNQQHFAT